MLSCKILDQYVDKECSRIAVATSGGADSMCLLYLAYLFCKASKTELVALIVDHKLRAESTQEANKVAHFIKSYGIKVKILAWEDKKPTANIQHHARKERYKLLTDYCKAHGIKQLLVAHNLQDQAETVLLRIYRGSGVDGIAGINKSIKFNEVEIVRPLLEVDRNQIERTLIQANWPWVEDPSNQNLKFERVKIRKLLAALPNKELWFKRIQLLAKNAKRTKDFLQQTTKEHFKQCIELNELGYATLDTYKFSKLHEEVGLRVLVKIFCILSGKEFKPRLKNVEKLFQKIHSNAAFIVTLGNLKIRTQKSTIVFYRELNAAEGELSLKPNSWLEWDYRFRIKVQAHGMKVASLGKENWVKLRKEVLNYPKLPFNEIYYVLPAIYNSKGIIEAIPHLNVVTLQTMAHVESVY